MFTKEKIIPNAVRAIHNRLADRFAFLFALTHVCMVFAQHPTFVVVMQDGQDHNAICVSYSMELKVAAKDCQNYSSKELDNIEHNIPLSAIHS